MKKNIGTLDRLIRFILGVFCFVGVYFISDSAIKIILLIFGIFCIFQALFSWCAFYAIIGKNTCPIDKM